MHLPEFAGASSVAVYLPLRGEVQTAAVVRRCRGAGKTVCVPAFERRKGIYRFAELQGGGKLLSGMFGVMEPAKRKWVDLEDIDLVVVPGVAFDLRGGRLGHGRGYYDRLLKTKRTGNVITVGAAFDFQVFKRVPMGAKDIFMDVVVTEKREIRK